MTLDEREIAAVTDAVRRFATTELAPGSLDWDRDKHFPIDVIHRAGDLGLGGICVPEDHGGAGFNRAMSVRIFEELAQGDTAIAAYISIHNMVTSMVDKHARSELRDVWVPRMAALDALGSYCLTEPDAGSDAAALRTTAKRDGDDYVLDGVKQFISGAGSSHVYVVIARTGDIGPRGISAFLVPADVPGLSFGPNERKMGWNAQPTRQVVLDQVRVPAGHLLGAEGQGFSIAMNALNGGRLNIAACSLGGAQWALDRAVEHLRTREAFGGPLIAQQGLLFRLADMATDLEASRCLLHRAASAVDAGAPDAIKLCAMAKRFVTDASFEAANAALQLHGGYGYLAEYGIEKVVRDLRVHQILEGTNEIMRVIVGRALVEAA
ncbi:MAG: cyclohexanecarboxyl-CoA dehydrogenase [Marmoricola sp.]|nr:cyclohexanecarboxyl-CoA dehydrogenase [Marmoricola sp.]